MEPWSRFNLPKKTAAFCLVRVTTRRNLHWSGCLVVSDPDRGLWVGSNPELWLTLDMLRTASGI